jgi:hypothetical protein
MLMILRLPIKERFLLYSMMANKIKIFLIISVFSVGKTFAKPMYIQLNEMIKRTSCIAIGTFLGFNGKSVEESSVFYFKVDEYLKFGQLKTKFKTDTLELSRAHGGVYLAPGTKCVAFVNENGGFEWYGTTKNETISDQSVLYLEGFYDWNAYIVSPCMLSVTQLKDYLKDGSYTGSAYGDVHFFSNTTKQMEQSPIQIEISYTYTDDGDAHIYEDRDLTYTVSVNGIELSDFTNKARFGLPWHYKEILIEYRSNRLLQIKGQIKDLHPGANRWHCYFWVETPEELTYDEFAEFMKDPHKGHPYYELELKTNNKTYKILINEDTGGIGNLFGYKNLPIPISSLSTAPERKIVFKDDGNTMVLTLDSLLLSKDVFEFASDDLIHELRIGSATGKMTSEWNGSTIALGECTLSYKATHFAKY